MTARLSLVTAWLVIGHVVLAALYWLLLSVPESSVFMLVASALLVVALAVVFGIVEGGALAMLNGESVSSFPRWPMAALPAAWLGALLFVVTWFLVAHLSASWFAHRGEIDAFLMAKFRWAETATLHAGARWVFRFLSGVVGLSLALALAAAVAVTGIRAAARFAWIRLAFSPRRLLILAAILVVFAWLPWRAVDWRPAWLSPNWQETVFVGVKLALVCLSWNVGWALALRVAAGARRAS